MHDTDHPPPGARPAGGRPRAGVERLDHRAVAMVLAGGRGTRLCELTDWRAKPAVPFAGELKIIDFALSNCINAGLRRVSVLTQYKAQSLIRHVKRSWGFLDASLGEFVDVVPAQQQHGECWYAGTADAVWQNLDTVCETGAPLVLVLAGDHVYKMDYGVLLDEHQRAGVDVTVACLSVPLAQAPAFGVLQVDARGCVTDFQEKPACPRPQPGRPGWALASMGIYVFDAQVLQDVLARDAEDGSSRHDFGHDLLPQLVREGRVQAHDFARSCVNRGAERPYWRDVGTLDAYFDAHLDLVRPQPALDLYDDDWPIRSLPQHQPPAKFVHDEDGCRGQALDSLVSGGCVVDGAVVRRSLLFPRARVGPGSRLEETLLLPNVVVGRGCTLRRAIIEKHCVLPDGFSVGLDPAADARRFRVTAGGVVLVTPEMLGQSVRSRA